MSYIDQKDVLGASQFWKHDGLEARRFGRMTFLQHEFFRETLYQRNIISKTLEAGWELSRTESKHDGKTRNYTKTLVSVLWKFSRKSEAREIFSLNFRDQVEFIKNV